MTEKIFGREWQEIHALQQRAHKRQTVDTTRPAVSPPTEQDKAMLIEYGSIGELEAAGLHGVADRLRNG